MHTTPPSLLQQLRSPDDQRARRRFVDLYTPLLFYSARASVCRKRMRPTSLKRFLPFSSASCRSSPTTTTRASANWLRTVLTNKWREIQRRQPCLAAGGVLPEKAVAGDIAVLAEEEFQRHLAVRALELMQAEFQPNTWKRRWECACGWPAGGGSRNGIGHKRQRGLFGYESGATATAAGIGGSMAVTNAVVSAASASVNASNSAR